MMAQHDSARRLRPVEHNLMPTIDRPVSGRPGAYWGVSGYGDCLDVTAEEAAAIADAWRTIEQAILERTHGTQAVW